MTDLESKYNGIMTAYNSRPHTFQVTQTPIKNWSKEELLEWSKAVKADRNGKKYQFMEQYKNQFFAELFAAVMRGNELATTFTPRDAQIFAVLVLLNRVPSKGRLVEVSTGEGKSAICAMLATILVFLSGSTVEVISTSEVLARRDVKERKPFYNGFGIKVADNSDECYDAEIVYGEIGAFEGDLLKHWFLNQNTMGKRKFVNIIIDEVDSTMIDDAGKSVRLTGHIPGMEYLEMLLIDTWLKLDEHYKHPSEIEDTLRRVLTAHLNDLVTKQETEILIPNHLKEFAQRQVKKWVESAIKAWRMELDKDYKFIIEDNVYKVAVVDYQNTGTIHKTMSWGDGLHQFLQLKHELKLTAEHFVTCYMSNREFLKRYDKSDDPTKEVNIFGMTGTLGSKKAQVFLQELYPVDLAFIATYKPKAFTLDDPIISKDDEAWKSAIYSAIYKQAYQNKRAVLVICLSIREVNQLELYLTESMKYPMANVMTYSDNHDEKHAKVVQKKLDVGKVILATNLAGRGTDLKISGLVEKHGGLYVILTFLPDNLRIELQGFGRGARQGQPGGGIMILNINYIYTKYHKSLTEKNVWKMTVDDFKRLRDSSEDRNLKSFKEWADRAQTFKDKLFGKFTWLLNEHRRIRNNQKEYEDDYTQMTELWGLQLTEYEEIIQDAQSARDVTKMKSTINAKFDVFFKEMSVFDYKTAWKNQTYLTRKAITRLGEKRTDDAMKFADMAILIDSNFAFAAYYLRAEVRAFLGTHSASDIASDLEASKKIINRLIGLYKRYERKLNSGAYSGLKRQLDYKIELLSVVVANIDQAQRTLKACEKSRMKYYVSKWTSLSSDISKENNAIKYDEAVELLLFGLPALMTLKATSTPKSGAALAKVKNHRYTMSIERDDGVARGVVVH
ncbi:secA DEAD-like domain-containing protein [Ditylenchus destructor]|nr:secA DEAD-like domain-containing protein [Ditylenchus destructor]